MEIVQNQIRAVIFDLSELLIKHYSTEIKQNIDQATSKTDARKATLKIVVFGEKMPMPVASSKPFFCVRSRSLGLVDNKHEQSHRRKDEEIWMSKTN